MATMFGRSFSAQRITGVKGCSATVVAAPMFPATFGVSIAEEGEATSWQKADAFPNYTQTARVNTFLIRRKSFLVSKFIRTNPLNVVIGNS
jgi:hypothetical protein